MAHDNVLYTDNTKLTKTAYSEYSKSKNIKIRVTYGYWGTFNEKLFLQKKQPLMCFTENILRFNSLYLVSVNCVCSLQINPFVYSRFVLFSDRKVIAWSPLNYLVSHVQVSAGKGTNLLWKIMSELKEYMHFGLSNWYNAEPNDKGRTVPFALCS